MDVIETLFRFMPIKKKQANAFVYIPFKKIQGIGGFKTFTKNLKSYLNKNIILYLKSPKEANLIFRHEGIGGPTTFMTNLKNYLDKNEFLYLKSPKKARAIFFPESFSKRVLTSIKKRGGTVIQRLDGIYYPEKHQERYIELNRAIKEVYLNLSDFIIFQSEYSKKQCFALFGEKKEQQYTIIVNGVQKSVFFPDKTPKAEFQGKLKFVTTGNFRNIDMVEPIVKALDKIKDRIDFEYAIIGPIKNKHILPFLNRNYLTHTLIRDAKKLAEVLRKSDLFIYSFLNPPCPNSVIESISSGLPVVGFDSGAMKELLFFSKDLLAPVSQDVFQRYDDFDPEKLAEKIIFAADNYKFYKQKALDHSHLYSFDECGRKYLDVFRKFA